MAEQRTFPAFVDARGTLVVAELGALPFAAQRVFVVSAPEGGSTRGAHTTDCDQLLILASGGATVRWAHDRTAPRTELRLGGPGASISLPAGTWVEYDLHDSSSNILVFAAQLYVAGQR